MAQRQQFSADVEDSGAVGYGCGKRHHRVGFKTNLLRSFKARHFEQRLSLAAEQQASRNPQN